MGYLHFLANLFGQYTITDNTTWQEWEFSLDMSTPTSAAEFLSLLNDNDVLPRTRVFDMMMGARQDSTETYDFWNGAIDEVRLWNRALPTDEIEQIYDSEM